MLWYHISSILYVNDMSTCINNPHVFQTKKTKTSGLQQQMLRFRHAFEAGTLLLRLEDRRLRWSKVMGWFAKKDGDGILAARNGEHVALDEQIWKLGMLAGIMRILVMKTSDFTKSFTNKDGEMLHFNNGNSETLSFDQQKCWRPTPQPMNHHRSSEISYKNTKFSPFTLSKKNTKLVSLMFPFHT